MTTDSVVDAVNAMEEDNYQVPLVPSGETTFRGLGEDTEHRQLSGKSGKSSGKGSGKGGKSSKSGRLLEGDEAMEVDEEHRMLSHKSAKSSGKGSGKGSKSSKAR
ncbi:hypothetical protein IV203_004648 [Nitzschia inconspicua]|uniref:Uncharacterized protein n=1 Tax=Nitzschia inconspicua TaxID=303405 RepID=A0A9K3L4F1_9STRA|nr:hypothetical protein IV203_004648 [Nitzschia inconspicua]